MGEREDAFIPKLEAAIGTCDPEAVPLLEEMLKTYRRKNRRLERIIRQSDKQQMAMVKLNEELERTYGQLEEYKNRLEELRSSSSLSLTMEYDVYQQEIARKKVEAGIIAENSDGLAFQHLFVPSDILSGDFYSVYRKENGATFFFILDGQGHGISPSLTVFSVASIINRYVRTTGSLRELLDLVLPYVQQFLADGAVDHLLHVRGVAEEIRHRRHVPGHAEAVRPEDGAGGHRLPDHELHGRGGSSHRRPGRMAGLGGLQRRNHRGEGALGGSLRSGKAAGNPAPAGTGTGRDSPVHQGRRRDRPRFRPGRGTDGYPFGKKRFKEMIREYGEESMADQKELFMKALETYQGEEGRNDDITVVALKI